MQVTEIIQRGLDAKLISIDDEYKSVSYRAQNKKYRLNDPEEIVRAGAYVALILDYGYPADHVDIEYPTPDRVPQKIADIVVFKDKARKTGSSLSSASVRRPAKASWIKPSNRASAMQIP